MLICFSI